MAASVQIKVPCLQPVELFRGELAHWRRLWPLVEVEIPERAAAPRHPTFSQLQLGGSQRRSAPHRFR